MKKKVIALILCIVLSIGLCVPTLAAYNDDVTVSAALDTSTLDYDAENAQTVKLTVSLSREVSLYSMSMTCDVPDGLTLSSVASGSSGIELDAGDNYSLSTGKISWYKGTNKTAKDLVILTVTVPAGTAAGTYRIGVNTVKLATAEENDGNNWMSDGSAYANLTINGSVASEGAKLDKDTASVKVGGTVTLVPSLLPTGTTATVSSVTWVSSDISKATVDDNGVVTGVAEGTATITARVTASDNTTPWDATCVVTVSKTASPYTVSVKRVGTGNVHARESVTMNVEVSGGAYAGLETTVTYNKTLFTYSSGSAAISGAAIEKLSEGEIRIHYHGANVDAGNVATLSFTANEITDISATGNFGFSFAQACDIMGALSGTDDAATEGDSVTIVKQFTVKFMKADNGGQFGTDLTMDAGSKLTAADVPDPAEDYYDFTGWIDGDNNTYADAAAITNVEIKKDITFTATHTAKTYTVGLQTGLTGNAEKATYGKDYTVTVDPYESDCVYVVTYTVEGSSDVNTAEAGTDGKTFTIPGANIKGNLNITFTKQLNAEVNVYKDYVNGYYLITVASSGKAYKYDGKDMYYLNGQSKCALLVKAVDGADELTASAAKLLVTETNGYAGIVTFAANLKDVNCDGKVDINDAVVVNSALNKWYDVDAYMDVYLRCNVCDDTSTYKVEAEDVNAVIIDAAYRK